MRKFLAACGSVVVLLYAEIARGQASYRNLDAGFPVRVEDATVTERYALDLDLLNFRYDELSDLRTRFQYEPRISYGILPRTEAWLRFPVFYRERNALPRGGVAGIGFGAMHQLNLESEHLPSVALASEFFRPTGPNALPASYSFRTTVTRSFPAFRLHLNGSIASYAVRTPPSLIITCPDNPPPGTGCGGGGGALPPLDGPCSIGVQSGPAADFYCAAPQSQIQSTAQAAFPGQIETHDHWLLGAAIDRSFPLASTLVAADIFAEKFEGIGRKTDATAEFGARRQLTPQVVLVGALGRHFRGAGFSTFVTLGATISHAWQPFRRGP
jgi:hypothetical protein